MNKFIVSVAQIAIGLVVGGALHDAMDKGVDKLKKVIEDKKVKGA